MTDTQAASLANLAAELAAQPDDRSTRQRLVDLAQKATGCDLVVLWRLTADGTQLDTATDMPGASRLEGLLNQLSTARAWHSLHEEPMLHVQDVLTETRWPELASLARSQGVPFRSALAFPLAVADRPLGALLLYSDEPDFFTEEAVEFSILIAAHAVLALESARANERIEQLEVALRTNRTIGMAMGVLMARFTITESEAFDLLRVTSEQLQRKLREVAADVANTGDLPID